MATQPMKDGGTAHYGPCKRCGCEVLFAIPPNGPKTWPLRHKTLGECFAALVGLSEQPHVYEVFRRQ